MGLRKSMFRISSFFRITLLLVCVCGINAFAQKPHQPSSSEIYQGIKKLNVLGNVLYIAAHPDDENTRFIAYCANEKLFNTRYLSLTRGDGGQNLIGSELREELGIIRTQELIAARRLDGGQQSFSRANDFGYSKTSDETLRIWERAKVLEDIVWAIRNLRPDIIVCRFPTDSRGGHGHHSASAILGIEAFEKAADRYAFQDQLHQVSTWQAKRIVTNIGRWWNPDLSADDPNVVTEDIGAFNVFLGTSYNELAAESRSQHRSQGFGSTGTRGEMLEYFEHTKGLRADSSIFEGVNTGWSRVKGGADVEAICSLLAQEYDFTRPEKSLPLLLQLRERLGSLSDKYWQRIKLNEVDQLIRACTGIFIEAKADRHHAAEGDSLKIQFEVVNRSSVPMALRSISCEALRHGMAFISDLPFNVPIGEKHTAVVPMGAAISQPYWLAEAWSEGMYEVNDRDLGLLPENPHAFIFDVTVLIDGRQLSFSTPLIYKSNDPVRGEVYRPFVIAPSVIVTLNKDLVVCPKGMSKELEITVNSTKGDLSGQLQISAPEGWQISKAAHALSFAKAGDERRVTVSMTPSANASKGKLKATFIADGKTFDRSQRTISYDHIPTQTYFPKAEAHLSHIDVKRKGQRIGYLAGAGDAVADGLRAVGYVVDDLQVSDLSAENLKRYDAVVLGIRFLNVNEHASVIMPKLMQFAEGGGNVIIQYNTSRGLELDGLVPDFLKLGRDRVTEEDAEVRILLPDHSAFNVPNRITPSDFEGWSQERGLYFASEWGQGYQALLSMNDVGETPKDGSLLVAKYGKGHFVYTGLSFFRQFPAGVPGAHRLLVNLISLGK